MRQVLVGLCVSTPIFCLALIGSDVKADDDPAIAQVGRRVEELRILTLSPDGPRLGEIYADRLAYGHSDGRVQSKQQVIESLLGRKSVFHDIKISDQSIVVSGDAAVVRHKFDADVDSNGKSLKASINVLQVWQKQSNEWKILVRQAY